MLTEIEAKMVFHMGEVPSEILYVSMLLMVQAQPNNWLHPAA